MGRGPPSTAGYRSSPRAGLHTGTLRHEAVLERDDRLARANPPTIAPRPLLVATLRTMPAIEIVRATISLSHLRTVAEATFGELVKAVVDVERSTMAIGGELHADEEARLLDEGSRQAALWGINLYPADYPASGWLEFDSMINVRPGQGNRTRSVDDPVIRAKIIEIVGSLVDDR